MESGDDTSKRTEAEPVNRAKDSEKAERHEEEREMTLRTAASERPRQPKQHDISL